MKDMKETSLYLPVKSWLEANGYTVRAEVEGCDVVAVRDGEIVVVELKLAANMQLLIQATDRQRISDSVYVAVAAPKNRRSSHWRGVQRVLRALEIGLVTVDERARPPRVTVEFDPAPYARRKLGARRRAVLREVGGRSRDDNIGGSHRRRLMTAYREHAIRIAHCLTNLGPLSPAQLRSLGTGDKTRSILADNHYGWFQRVSRGVYEVTSAGVEAAKAHPEFAHP